MWLSLVMFVRKVGKLMIFSSCSPWEFVPNFFVDFKDDNLAMVDWVMIFLNFCFQLVIALQTFPRPVVQFTRPRGVIEQRHQTWHPLGHVILGMFASS